ncbi:hypothetical protein [Burkholderia gladioli]|uniref:hypothetical protein n=1 Tax=Burkholderia gladioli TaxID=28095 RepID=UPI00164045F4|nr:hypothetical protein [Burkholderia gladioli]
MARRKANAVFAAFEVSMRKWAIQNNIELSFERDTDGKYRQLETHTAFSGWLEAYEMIAAQLRDMVQTERERCASDQSRQCSFRQCTEAFVARLNTRSDDSPASPDEATSDVATAVHGATFDDLIVDAFARLLKQEIAKSRVDGRSRLWSLSTDALGAAFHSAVAEGDPLQITMFSLSHWHRGETVSARPPGALEFALSGELVRLAPSSRPNSGGALTLRAQDLEIDIDGWPEDLLRACKPLLFESVDFVVRSTSAGLSNGSHPQVDLDRLTRRRHWIPAGRAAYESGVDLDVVREWVRAGEVEHREDKGMLLVDRESIITRSHRHWRQRDSATGRDRQAGSMQTNADAPRGGAT